MQAPHGACNWNEDGVNILARINWRTSLVPAPAVIPAPIAYIKVVAVKTLVVGDRGLAQMVCWGQRVLLSEPLNS